MTMNDWIGVLLALLSFGGMVAAYVLVFRPSNKAAFEAQRGMALDDDDPVKFGDER
jgi:cbb3-type cytochrome oxidase subunit 3